MESWVGLQGDEDERQFCLLLYTLFKTGARMSNLRGVLDLENLEPRAVM